MLYIFKYAGQELVVEQIPHQSLRSLATDAVRELEPLPYGESQRVEVKIYEASYKNGKLVAGPYKTTESSYRRVLPMSSAEFEEQEKELFARIPEAFHGFVSSYAYEHGHSSGYSEILLYLDDLVDGIETSLKKMKG